MHHDRRFGCAGPWQRRQVTYGPLSRQRCFNTLGKIDVIERDRFTRLDKTEYFPAGQFRDVVPHALDGPDRSPEMSVKIGGGVAGMLDRVVDHADFFNDVAPGVPRLDLDREVPRRIAHELGRLGGSGGEHHDSDGDHARKKAR